MFRLEKRLACNLPMFQLMQTESLILLPEILLLRL
jgi:hypothetical protein